MLRKTRQLPKYTHLHPKDDKMLVVSSLDQFKFWKHKKKLNIEGICFDLGLSKEALKALSDAALKGLRKSTTRRFQKGHLNLSSYNEHILPLTEENTRETLTERGYEENLITLSSQLTHIYLQHARLIKNANGHHPDPFKIHANLTRTAPIHRDRTDSLVLAFNYTGVIINTSRAENREDVNPRKEYAIPAGVVALISPAVWHRSPNSSQAWKDEPRTNIVI